MGGLQPDFKQLETRGDCFRDSFANHEGVDWDALEKAWEKNAKAEARAAASQKPATKTAPGKPAAARPPKIVGGSTITSSNWPRTCFSRVSAHCCAKGRNWC